MPPAEEEPKGPEMISLPSQQVAYIRDRLEKFVAESPELEKFDDLYPSEEIEADRNDIRRLRARFQKETSPNEKEFLFYAQLLEMIIMEFSSSWIPGYLSRATEYDDIKRRTDLFLEIEDDDGNIVRLAIDVTASVFKAREKVKQIINDLQKGIIHQVKYFESEREEKRGFLELPRFVIGSDFPGIIDLAVLLYRHGHSQPEQKAEILKEIEQNPFGQDMKRALLYQVGRYREALRLAPTFRQQYGSSTVDSIIEQLNKIEILLMQEIKKAPGRDVRGSRYERPNKVLEAILEELSS